MMRVALTWDDGPSEWTEPILDLLAQHDARATFFVCGFAIVGREDLLTRMMAEGHEIGNHTFTHPRITRLTDHEAEHELWMTSEAIRDATGLYPRYWRAPHFDHDARVDGIALNMGMTHVGCTVNTGDWNEPRAERIAQLVTSTLSDGAIIDMHDGLPPDGGSGTASRQPTVDATGLILPTAGVEWVTVGDLERE